jgi:excisionase family DNA binding protein
VQFWLSAATGGLLTWLAFRNTHKPVAEPRGSRMAFPGTAALTVREVADQLRVSPGWVTDHATAKRKPHLPGIKVGKYWRLRAADVIGYLDLCAAMSREEALRKK